MVRSRGSEFPWRGWCTTGREARPYPGAIEEVNEVTPLSSREGKRTARDADEAAEEGEGGSECRSVMDADKG